MSIKLAHPEVTLVGVDFSASSTGLHHPVFDEVVVLPPWDILDLTLHRKFIESSVSKPENLWISGLDLEVVWLSSLGFSNQVLVPPPTALEAIRKPATGAAIELGFRTPRQLRTNSSCLVEDFLDQGGWPLWVKGARYEAIQVNDRVELDSHLAQLRQTWGEEPIVQEHVNGVEQSIAFAARDGQLLSAIRMDKLTMTELGKTWSGSVEQLSESETIRLKHFVEKTQWSGGGEIEIVKRAWDGALFLIDLNPRFPAWINGATVSGAPNLPAALVGGGTWGARKPNRFGNRFVRIVTEIKARDGLALPFPTPGASLGGSAGKGSKHPSGMPQLSRRMNVGRAVLPIEAALTSRNEQLERLSADVDFTPTFRFDLNAMKSEVERVSEAATAAGLLPAYSIKTNPGPNLLRVAASAGWLGEAITGLEVEAALEAGWSSADIILNGPAKLWPATDPSMPFRAVFFDSIEEAAEGVTQFPNAQYLGVRARPFRHASRFGVNLNDGANMRSLARELSRVPPCQELGIHMHIASSTIGLRSWVDEMRSLGAVSSALGQMVGRPIRLLDLGGGFSPTGLTSGLRTSFPFLSRRLRYLAPDCELIAIEPGKAVTAPYGFVFTRVLEKREDDVVADASIAELSDHISMSHPVFLRSGANWHELQSGKGAIFGRSCIEGDVIGRSLNLETIRKDDLLAFGNAGAYDSSMRYSFASGGTDIVTK